MNLRSHWVQRSNCPTYPFLFLSFSNLVTIYTVLPSTSSDVDNGFRKLDSRTPRYIDTRMDEVYAVKKSRLRMLSVKDNTKVFTFFSYDDTNFLIPIL